jgi:YcaO-like protein with predicted kinase domain
MELRNYVRNEYGKADTPENTIKRIEEGIERLGLNIRWKTAYQVSEYIFSASLTEPVTRLNVNGKGITAEFTEASALAEFAERFSFDLQWSVPKLDMFFNDSVRRFLNYEWLRGYVKSHPDDLRGPHIKIEQLFQNENKDGLTKKSLEYIKNSDAASHWVDGYSLLRDAYVKVPFEFTIVISSTNGLASGNTIEEAIIHGACECFERYALISVVKQEKVVPTIDRDTIHNPIIKSMIGFYLSNNIDVMIKDLSLGDLLPVAGVCFINKNLDPNHMEYRRLSPGASFDYEEALTRCFTERMQGLPNFTPHPNYDRPVVKDGVNFRTLPEIGIIEKDVSYLEEGNVIPNPAWTRTDIFQELDRIRDICRKLKSDCIVVDTTHPILKFPAVRIIMPGISDMLSFFSPLNDRLRQKQIMRTFFV